MKKRALAILLAIVLLAAMVPLSAGAATIVAGGANESMGWSLDNEGTLTIYGTGPMENLYTYYGYLSIPPLWAEYASDTTKVVIESGVTSVGKYAFEGYHTLKSVTIPSSVTTIEANAFYECTSLSNIIIPDSVTIIGAGAFEECTAITSITIPDSVTSIGIHAFEDCALTSIAIPSSVTSIGNQAFGYYLDTTTWNVTKVPGFTIYGYTGTAAEKYAKDNGFKFVALTESNTNFTDVKEKDWYYTPVQWAVANGVTSGTSDTTFSPGNKCTRAQAVTFLWNAKGQPEPKSTKNPFTDVKSNAWYYKAVLWAVENNITSGTSETTFSPNNTCTRGQIVTFFHNYAGKPAASGKNPFTDVPEKQWYYQPILWAVSEGVTAGLTPTTFGPTNTCTRGQIVTFLYNYLGKK